MKLFQGLWIHLKMNNATSLSYVNKLGGTVFLELNSLTKGMWLCCLERHITHQTSHLAGVEHNSQQGIMNHEGHSQLYILSKDFQKKSTREHDYHRWTCSYRADQPATRIFELEARPKYHGNSCLHPELDEIQRACQPSRIMVEYGGKSTDKSDTRRQN